MERSGTFREKDAAAEAGLDPAAPERFVGDRGSLLKGEGEETKD